MTPITVFALRDQIRLAQASPTFRAYEHADLHSHFVLVPWWANKAWAGRAGLKRFYNWARQTVEAR